MTMNPALKKLGFSAGDRVAVIHADDIGMCRSTLVALEELIDLGTVTSASAMVPCPGFPEVAAWRRRNPAADLGVHLTLTSEWNDHRWRPVSPDLDDRSLTDERGYLHRTVDAFRHSATTQAVRAEISAQLQHAQQLGIAPSHLDTHMYALLCDPFLDDYLRLAFIHGLTAFLPRAYGETFGRREGLPETADLCERRGMAVFDHCEVVTKQSRIEDRDALVREVLRGLPAGLSCVILHPVADAAELRHISADWRGRIADYETFRQPALLDFVHRQGIHLISYAALTGVSDF